MFFGWKIMFFGGCRATVVRGVVVTITFMMTWLCNTSCMINSPFTAMINKYHAWSIAYHSMINRFHAWSTAFHSMINKFHAWSIAYHSMINKFHTWSTWSMIMNDHWSLISYMINGVHKAMINYQAHFFYIIKLRVHRFHPWAVGRGEAEHHHQRRYRLNGTFPWLGFLNTSLISSYQLPSSDVQLHGRYNPIVYIAVQ